MSTAGEDTSVRAAFTDEEWKNVKEGLGCSVLYMTAVGKSGPVQIAMEVAAGGKALATASTSDPLLEAITADLKERDSSDKMVLPDGVDSKDELRTLLLEKVSAALATVTEKAPDSAAAYRSALLDMAQATAEAAKEGSFMGIGGTRVTEEEKAALEALESALDASPATAPSEAPAEDAPESAGDTADDAAGETPALG